MKEWLSRETGSLVICLLGRRKLGKDCGEIQHRGLRASFSTSQAGSGATHTVPLSFERVDGVTVVAKAGSGVETQLPQCPNPLFFPPHSYKFLVTRTRAEAGVQRFWGGRRKWSCPELRSRIVRLVSTIQSSYRCSQENLLRPRCTQGS